jgi:hypothetical protein
MRQTRPHAAVTLGLFAAVLLGIACCETALAQVGIEAVNEPLLNELVSRKKVAPPQVDVKTVDAQGRVQRWTSKVSARWVWLDKSPRSRTGQIAVAINWESLKGLGGAKSDAEFKPERFTGLEIDRTVGNGNSLKLELTTDRTLTQVVTKEVAVFFTLRSSSPYVDIGPECEELGVRFSMTSKLPRALLYVGARCESIDDKAVEVRLFVPSDSALRKTPLLSKAKLGPGWIKTLVSADQIRAQGKRVPLGDLELSGSGTKLTVYRDRVKNQGILAGLKRWSLNWGLGLSYLDYNEKPDDEKIQIAALTGKVAGSAQLIPNRLDVGASAYVNLYPMRLSASPADLDPKRFFGVNLRMGYTLPFDPRWVQWSLSLGTYLWGMFGSDPRYGVNLLSGPQVYLVARKSLSRGRGWFAYGKFTPIGSSLSALNASDREVAAGGGWTWKLGRRTAGVTLDISNLQFSLAGTENSISLSSYSLGMQFGF